MRDRSRQLSWRDGKLAPEIQGRATEIKFAFNPAPSRRRAILNAPTPTQALRRAAERYRELIGVQ